MSKGSLCRTSCIKRVACALLALLWLGVSGLGLEVYTRWHQHRVEKSNVYVVAAQKDIAMWQHLDLDEDGQPVVKTLDDAVVPSPSPTPIADDEHLGTKFAALNEADRELFATLREIIIAVYEPDGNNLGLYGAADMPAMFGIQREAILGKPFNASALASQAKDGLLLIQRTVQTAKPETASFNVNLPHAAMSFELRAYPMKDASGVVTSVACVIRNITGLPLTETLARQQDTAKNPMWKEMWFEYRKNAYVNSRWHTNNVGFRDRDIQLPKPPGLFRILCIGGSTTEEGLTNETTYPKFLEKELRDAFPGHAIEVVNCGVVGLDSLGERRRALDYVQLEPDLVIEYNAVNDICHSLLPEWNKHRSGWRLGLAHSVFLTYWANAWLCPDGKLIDAGMEQATFRNLRAMVGAFKTHAISVAFCSFAYPDANRMKHAEKDYMEWNLRTAWQGGSFTFATYTHLVDVYNAKLRAFCGEQDCTYLPLSEHFSGDITVFGDITHLRPKGMQLKAKVIAEFLTPYLRDRLK